MAKQDHILLHEACVLWAHLRHLHVGHALGCSPFHRARHCARSIYHNRLQHGINDSNHLVFFFTLFLFLLCLRRSAVPPPSFRLSLASMSSPPPHSPLFAHDKSPSRRKDRPPALEIRKPSASPSHLSDRPSAEDSKSHVEQVMSAL